MQLPTTKKNKKKRIQIDPKYLPPESTELLKQKNSAALKYWNISQIWNNRISSTLPVCDAIYELNKLAEATPQQLISERASELSMQIVNFGSKQKYLRANSNTPSPSKFICII